MIRGVRNFWAGSTWEVGAPQLTYPTLIIIRSASGHISSDSKSAVQMGLLLPVSAPSTNNWRLDPISIGGKKVDAALVARAASQILQISYNGS